MSLFQKYKYKERYRVFVQMWRVIVMQQKTTHGLEVCQWVSSFLLPTKWPGWKWWWTPSLSLKWRSHSLAGGADTTRKQGMACLINFVFQKLSVSIFVLCWCGTKHGRKKTNKKSIFFIVINDIIICRRFLCDIHVHNYSDFSECTILNSTSCIEYR